jgi:catechol 2,3-dioxygenase-like lactoylglutathione lyase family enzyme
MITFDHVALSVSNLDAAIEWYRAAFGMEPTMKASIPGFDLAMIDGPGGMRLELFEKPGSTRTVDSSTPTTVMDHRGYTHLAVTTDELVADHDRLVAIGGSSVWDPRPAPEPGRAMAFIHDPDGNLIELMGPLTPEIEANYPDGHTTK